MSYLPPQPPRRSGEWARWLIGAAIVVAVAIVLGGILVIAFINDRLSGLIG
jgi:ABC-type phosphate transport system auxiliary subunit